MSYGISVSSFWIFYIDAKLIWCLKCFVSLSDSHLLLCFVVLKADPSDLIHLNSSSISRFVAYSFICSASCFNFTFFRYHTGFLIFIVTFCSWLHLYAGCIGDPAIRSKCYHSSLVQFLCHSLV